MSTPDAFSYNDVVFIIDLDVATMISRKQTELKKDRPDVQTFARMMEGLLEAVRLTESKDIDGVVNLYEVEDKKFKPLRNFYEYHLPDIAHLPWERFKPESHDYVARYKIMKDCLELIARMNRKLKAKSYTTVVFTDDGVAHGAFQLMTSALAYDVKLDNIYSTATKSFEYILAVVKERFGREIDIGVLTSNKEILEAADEFDYVAWEIKENHHLENFLNYLKNYFITEEEKGKKRCEELERERREIAERKKKRMERAKFGQPPLVFKPSIIEQMRKQKEEGAIRRRNTAFKPSRLAAAMMKKKNSEENPEPVMGGETRRNRLEEPGTSADT